MSGKRREKGRIVVKRELTRKSALNGRYWGIRKLDLPEFAPGFFTYIRRFSAKSTETILAMRAELEDNDAEQARAAAALCVVGVCDKKGVALFGVDDIDAVLEWPYAAIVRCATEIADFNGISVAAEDERKKK